ncbi:hypothetical protein B484DRAFT_101878 [Ochromonadaceae sp. CCMP2298]|nr:hypothetical protein B484DRAFT_101878 [Ochromonadaceae sp. CCMP2298]
MLLHVRSPMPQPRSGSFWSSFYPFMCSCFKKQIFLRARPALPAAGVPSVHRRHWRRRNRCKLHPPLDHQRYGYQYCPNLRLELPPQKGGDSEDRSTHTSHLHLLGYRRRAPRHRMVVSRARIYPKPPSNSSLMRLLPPETSASNGHNTRTTSNFEACFVHISVTRSWTPAEITVSVVK